MITNNRDWCVEGTLVTGRKKINRGKLKKPNKKN
jgi:hypothetical protein